MDDHREGIQIEKPVPPWERPGYFRRDCEPHRSYLLWCLGFVSLFLGVLSLFPFCGLMPGIVGISLGLCSRYMAKADLAKMRSGRMNPYGEGVTDLAMSLINNGLGFSIFGTILWGGLILFVRLLQSR